MRTAIDLPVRYDVSRQLIGQIFATEFGPGEDFVAARRGEFDLGEFQRRLLRIAERFRFLHRFFFRFDRSGSLRRYFRLRFVAKLRLCRRVSGSTARL